MRINPTLHAPLYKPLHILPSLPLQPHPLLPLHLPLPLHLLLLPLRIDLIHNLRNRQVLLHPRLTILHTKHNVVLDVVETLDGFGFGVFGVLDGDDVGGGEGVGRHEVDVVFGLFVEL